MNKNLTTIIELALREDLAEKGDVTSQAIFDNQIGTYQLIAKDSGILCGKDVFISVFNKIDPQIKLKFNFNDGDILNEGQLIAEIDGNVKNILIAERTALNFISHLSGIATKTRKFVEKTKDKIKILDTRKTLPGYRELHKYAVKCGGGFNHRIGLFDMVMIKDNHIDAAGGITNAVNNVRLKWANEFKIEVETRTIDEVKEALGCNVDRIMLDNMNQDIMQKAIDIINKKAEIEVSGNVTFDRLNELIKLDIDFVSIGELTHTIKAFDFSLKKIK